MLWGQGTFIHRELVTVPIYLMHEIQEDILATLNLNDIPYVCLNGFFFEKYKTRLSAENIPNPPALYSCLRSVKSTTLSFAEYPYCLKKGREAVRPPIHLILEDYLAKQCGPVSRKQLKNFADTVLGVEKTQLGSYIGKMPNVLRFEASVFIHFKALSVEKRHLAPIVDNLLELKGSPITARKLYLQNMSVCQNLGISTPMLLSGLIQYFYPGDFPFTSLSNGSLGSFKPRLARSAKKTAGRSGKPAAARSVKPPAARSGKPAAARPARTEGCPAKKQILAYLVDRGKPCSTRSLLDMVRGKGHSLDYLYIILADKEKFLWYTTEAVVTRQALDWTDEKQAAIEQLASSHLEKSGGVFGLCSEIYRDGLSQLPELAQHISWTSVLLQELLGSQSRYLALGRSRDIYVSASNSHGIANLNDLSLYLLQTDYGGAAARALFNSRLRSLGIMRRKLSTFVSGKDKRVVIDGDIIRIADRE